MAMFSDTCRRRVACDSIPEAAKDSDVLIDPVRALGRPAIRSVPTEILAEGFRAGASATSLADLYELKLDQVEQALRFEMVQADALGA